MNNSGTENRCASAMLVPISARQHISTQTLKLFRLQMLSAIPHVYVDRLKVLCIYASDSQLSFLPEVLCIWYTSRGPSSLNKNSR